MKYYEVIISYADGKEIYKLARTISGANAIVAKEIRNNNTKGATVIITDGRRTILEQTL